MLFFSISIGLILFQLYQYAIVKWFTIISDIYPDTQYHTDDNLMMYQQIRKRIKDNVL